MRAKFFLACLIALLAGLGASEILYRSVAFRDWAGQRAGRGHLITVVNGKGIYETDLGGDDGPAVSDLIVAENLRRVAAQETIDPARVDQELVLIKVQFPSERTFEDAVEANGFSISSLRERIATELRSRQWLEKQMTPTIPVNQEECRRLYLAHQDFFTQPIRYRASHLFLAAHAETPPDVVEEKEAAIALLAERLGKREPLAQLAIEASEDEATKSREGDLGIFSEARMLPEFIAEVKKLRVGQVSRPFRSPLGFHIAQVTEIKPARLLSFEEAQPEIFVALTDERRALQGRQIAANLSASR
jgi:hypothetical protein